ncbi:MAG: class I SAM-dependent methyltransferase [Giesbergeria sp.]|nr:class I SAM-dependent methyltransferase [Giesbergeria sp.]
MIEWNEQGEVRSARWRSESGAAAPRRVELAKDTLSADSAYRFACAGTAMLWRSDFQNARLMLQALQRRIEDKPPKAAARAAAKIAASTPEEVFHLHRQAQSQRARSLGTLVIQVEGDYSIKLRRAPDWKEALTEAWGPATGEVQVVSLRELLGVVGAHEWRKKGVEIAALGEAADGTIQRIHPHYGVFSPVRGEYIDLIAKAPLPSKELAFDIGTGTGVLAAVLARCGVRHIVATENAPRAYTCAKKNIKRLGLVGVVEVQEVDMFPAGQAPLVVCNPPWLPARPSSPIEHAIYDEGSHMLRGFLSGLAAHLSPKGEGWLVLSDLAEHLGLRTREQLLAWIAEGGLRVIERHDVRPEHAKATEGGDALAAARAAEVTSLWRLAAA